MGRQFRPHLEQPEQELPQEVTDSWSSQVLPDFFTPKTEEDTKKRPKPIVHAKERISSLDFERKLGS